MEFPQYAPFDGWVNSVYVSSGEEVQAGQLIVALSKGKRGVDHANDESAAKIVNH